VRLVWTDHDQHARLSRLAIIGLAVGIAIAIFGLPPVDIHGPLHYLGIMDPLCGATRGARLALQGHLAQAWRYNPLSVALVAGSVATVLRQVLGMATRRWLDLNVVRRDPVLAIAALLTMALEINQQAHAALLRTSGARFPFAGVTVIMAGGAVGLVVVMTTRCRRRSDPHGAPRHGRPCRLESARTDRPGGASLGMPDATAGRRVVSGG